MLNTSVGNIVTKTSNNRKRCGKSQILGLSKNYNSHSTIRCPSRWPAYWKRAEVENIMITITNRVQKIHWYSSNARFNCYSRDHSCLVHMAVSALWTVVVAIAFHLNRPNLERFKSRPYIVYNDMLWTWWTWPQRFDGCVW
jgi:hypothetical protein